MKERKFFFLLISYNGKRSMRTGGSRERAIEGSGRFLLRDNRSAWFRAPLQVTRCFVSDSSQGSRLVSHSKDPPATGRGFRVKVDQFPSLAPPRAFGPWDD